MCSIRSLALSFAVLSIGLAVAHAQQEPGKAAKAEDKDPTLIKRIPVGKEVYSAHWSGDGKIMTTNSSRVIKDVNQNFQTVKIWDARSGKLLHSLGELNHPGGVYHELSHDGATLMIAPAGGFYASDLGKSEIRIAYVLNEGDLRKSVELLRVALERYARRDISG